MFVRLITTCGIYVDGFSRVVLLGRLGVVNVYS